MTEKEINRRYIENRLREVVPSYCLGYSLLEEVRKMLSEAYVEGLEQGHFDRKMDYEAILEKVREEKWEEQINGIKNLSGMPL